MPPDGILSSGCFRSWHSTFLKTFQFELQKKGSRNYGSQRGLRHLESMASEISWAGIVVSYRDWIKKSWFLHGSALRLLHLWYGCWLGILGETPDNGDGVVSDSFVWDPFSSSVLPHLALMWVFVIDIIVSCAVFNWCPWMIFFYYYSKGTQEVYIWRRGKQRSDGELWSECIAWKNNKLKN